MAGSKNLGGSRMPLSAAPGSEVIGSGPRIPAVAPVNSGPQSPPADISPMAYSGLGEGGFDRFSEDLNGTDGRDGDIPAVSPGAPAAFHHFAEDDYVNSTSDNGGHIGAVGHTGRA